jgi:N-acetylglucosaminyldiphosphoundecaprenol N-acetyl-beta-D-mannosaminyltransferase
MSRQRMLPPVSRFVLSLPVHVTDYRDALSRIQSWADAGESRSVFAATVNNVLHAHDSPTYREFSSSADLVVADGMPIVWTLRCLGEPSATRVYGPDLMLRLLDLAHRCLIPVGFYGGTPHTLTRLLQRVRADWPGLRITYAFSPPFRALSPQENAEILSAITDAKPSLLFVGLGCPRQEESIGERRGTLPSVMLGVGAAFDFLAGTKKQAPRWMMRLGLEWLFRLACEPRRLARRYLIGNPRFLVLLARQMLSRSRATP